MHPSIHSPQYPIQSNRAGVSFSRWLTSRRTTCSSFSLSLSSHTPHRVSLHTCSNARSTRGVLRCDASLLLATEILVDILLTQFTVNWVYEKRRSFSSPKTCPPFRAKSPLDWTLEQLNQRDRSIILSSELYQLDLQFHIYTSQFSQAERLNH